MLREIEFETLISMVREYVLPASFDYKKQLLDIVISAKEAGLNSTVELKLSEKINGIIEKLYDLVNEFEDDLNNIGPNLENRAMALATSLLSQAEIMAKECNKVEELVPDNLWRLPKYYDLLFLK